MDTKFIKKGQLIKGKDGELTLINGDYRPYPVDEDVINVWDRLDGSKTILEVATEIVEDSDKSVDEIMPNISLLVKELGNIDLVTSL